MSSATHYKGTSTRSCCRFGSHSLCLTHSDLPEGSRDSRIPRFGPSGPPHGQNRVLRPFLILFFPLFYLFLPRTVSPVVSGSTEGSSRQDRATTTSAIRPTEDPTTIPSLHPSFSHPTTSPLLPPRKRGTTGMRCPNHPLERLRQESRENSYKRGEGLEDWTRNRDPEPEETGECGYIMNDLRSTHVSNVPDHLRLFTGCRTFSPHPQSILSSLTVRPPRLLCHFPLSLFPSFFTPFCPILPLPPFLLSHFLLRLSPSLWLKSEHSV